MLEENCGSFTGISSLNIWSGPFRVIEGTDSIHWEKLKNYPEYQSVSRDIDSWIHEIVYELNIHLRTDDRIFKVSLS